MCTHLHKRVNPKLLLGALGETEQESQRRGEEKVLSSFTLYSSVACKSFIFNKYII